MRRVFFLSTTDPFRTDLGGGSYIEGLVYYHSISSETLMTKIPVPEQDEKAFCALLSELKLDRSLFKVELTQHSPPTYGPTVSTVELVWNGRLTIQYGAAAPSHWVTQFRSDWASGLLPETMSELAI